MRETVEYLLRRAALSLLFVAVAATVVFGIVHFGVADPADATAATPEEQSSLAEKKAAFGLDRPITAQYVDYMGSMFRFDFGETWADRDEAVAEQRTSVDGLVEQRLGRTAWLWLWTGLLALPLTIVGVVAARYTGDGRDAGILGKALPAFLLAAVFETVFFNLGQLLLGLDWRPFLAPTPSSITRPLPVGDLGTTDGVLLATKLAIPPALALAVPLAGTLAFLWSRGLASAADRSFVDAARAKGLHGGLVRLKHVLPVGAVPVLLVAGELAAVLVGMTMLVEVVFSLEGLGSLLYISVVRNDYTTLQASVFVFVVFVAAVDWLGAAGHSLLGGDPTRRRRGVWGGTATTEHDRSVSDGGPVSDGGVDTGGDLSPRRHVDGIRLAVRATPRPALVWAGAGAVLVLLQFGALVDTLSAFVPGIDLAGVVPRLLDRRLVPNAGYRLPGGGWAGTAFGLSPAAAWLLRVGLVYAYAAAVALWLRHGYRLLREVYRPATWHGGGAFLARLRAHRAARVGGAVVAVLLVAAVFAPALGTVPADRTFMHSSLDATEGEVDGSGAVDYLDTETGTIESAAVSQTITRTRSTSLGSVGPGQYDEFGQFHPFGTTYFGTDLFTEMLFGLRSYLFVATVVLLTAGFLVLLAGALTLQFGRPTAAGIDGVAGLLGLFPAIPFLFLTVAWFHPAVSTLSTQFQVVGVLFGLLAWPRLWRTIRPLLAEIDGRAWVDAGTAFGQPRSRTVVRELRPVGGVLVAYGLVAAGGAIAGTAGLSYLGHLSVGAPYGAFEWGGLLWRGQNFMLTSAGHTFVFPAVGLACLFAAVQALAAGIRDAATADRPDETSSAGEVGGLTS
ncbi:ABC transporter permease subunit [Haloglomus salinum]|uniref:ABC transporter permease subunit n=1 Tax=Haloglomus salinum TaxID=2962673 RepID=UPI0020C995CC|nr:ABC transporter permease subunit [Haloglomus salinum]